VRPRVSQSPNEGSQSKFAIAYNEQAGLCPGARTSLRERLKLMNGVFSIDSQRERGTKIRASVPLREWFRLRGLRMKHPNLRTK